MIEDYVEEGLEVVRYRSDLGVSVEDVYGCELPRALNDFQVNDRNEW